MSREAHAVSVVANSIGPCATLARAGRCILCRVTGLRGPQAREAGRPLGDSVASHATLKFVTTLKISRSYAVAHESAPLDRARAGFGLVSGMIGFAMDTDSPRNTAIALS